jgi:aromatic-L-amino-acid decarboxylase
MGAGENSPLALDAEQMRALGYRTIDMLVDRLTADPGPVVRSGSPEELRARLSTPPPEEPQAFDEILATLERDVLPYVARISHDTCWWLGASGPTTIELVVLDWLRQWVGYPEGAAGVLVSGGSAANLTALACARETRGGAIVYLCDQTHSSVARAARVLGFSPEQVRVVPSDEDGRIHVAALLSALAADRAAGRAPRALP